MTVTVIDDFAGANGTPISAAKWNRLFQTGMSGTVQSGRGRIRGLSDATNNYKKGSIESVATYGRGRYRVDVYLDRASTGGTINQIAFGVLGTNAYDAFYTTGHITGYTIESRPSDGRVVIFKTIDEQPRDLAGAANGGLPLAEAIGPTWTNGDTLHLEVEPSASGLAVRVWKNAEARPANPTVSTTDTTFTSGEVKLGVQSSDPNTDVWAEFFALTYDDLVTTNTTANAGPDQAVAPNATVTLVGLPPRGSTNQPGVWSQVSGPTQSLGSPVTSIVNSVEATRVTFVASNVTASAAACTFRYTVG